MPQREREETRVSKRESVNIMIGTNINISETCARRFSSGRSRTQKRKIKKFQKIKRVNATIE